jgi:hypothetical protein
MSHHGQWFLIHTKGSAKNQQGTWKMDVSLLETEPPNSKTGLLLATPPLSKSVTIH